MPPTYSDVDSNGNTRWALAAKASGLPVFPISVFKADGKWHKKPLVEDWVERANYFDLTNFDWSRANGYGIAMGPKSQLYAIDIDSYKPECDAEKWLKAHDVPLETRTHRTISGGTHKIYALSNGYRELRTRANVVPGLDTRGAGGFIAFGEGYDLIDDRAPVLLPRAACEELAASSDAAEIGELPGYIQADEMTRTDLGRRLKASLLANQSFLRRWKGDATGMIDGSRSALDQSIAFIMTARGFTEQDIMTTLLEFYRHGSARTKPPRMAIRAAQRCAARARITVDIINSETRDVEHTDNTDQEEATMDKIIAQGQA